MANYMIDPSMVAGLLGYGGTTPEEQVAGKAKGAFRVALAQGAAPKQATATAQTSAGPAQQLQNEQLSEYNAALEERNKTVQDLFNQRRQSMQEARTNNAALAKYNALGNALRALVQPLGWGLGSGFENGVLPVSTGGYQPADNRQYIEAFNRALKADNDLRNVGVQELETQLKYADENVADARRRDYMREQQQMSKEAAEQRHNYTMAEVKARSDKRKEELDARSEARMKELGARADASLDQIRLRASLSSRGKTVPRTERQRFDEKVRENWLKAMDDYEKGRTATPPADFETYYKQRAAAIGYDYGPAKQEAKPAAKSTRRSADLGAATNNNSTTKRKTANL